MTTIKKLCEDFNIDINAMTKGELNVIKLLTHWTEHKIKSRTKSLEDTIKRQSKKITALEKMVGNFKKPAPGDSDFKFTKRGKILITEYKDVILITGNTYDIRPIIKSYDEGSRPTWNSEFKGWVLSKENNVDDMVKELDEVTTVQVAESEKILMPTED